MPAKRVADGATQRTCAELQPTDPATLLGLLGKLALPVSVIWWRCGGTEPVSLTSSSAVRRPALEGVNLTLTVHLPPFAASVAPEQVSPVSMKLLGFAPAITVEVIGMTALVSLNTVMVCPGDAVPAGIVFVNVAVAGPKPTDEAVAVPDTATVWVGLLGALSCTTILADRWPVAVGTNCTVMVHVAFAARKTVEAQLESPTEKSPGLAPVTVVLLYVSVPVPLFVSVMSLVIDDVLTGWLPNVVVPGVTLACGLHAVTAQRHRLPGHVQRGGARPGRARREGDADRAGAVGRDAARCSRTR